jgi:UPF0755 protein
MRLFHSFRLYIILLLFPVGAGLTAGGWFALYVLTPAPGAEERVVRIPKGAGVRRIKGILVRQGIIRDDIRFLVLVRLLSVIEQPPRLRAGEFRVPGGLTPLETVRFLDTAKPVRYRVTVPEGKTMAETADIFAQGKWVDPVEFMRLCRDREFIRALGVEAESLEGYLFPETYTLVRGEADERIIITSMVRRFFAVWKDVSAGREQVGRAGRGGGLDRRGLLTLASIVEKETGAAAERDVIAGVFYNRLDKGMRLQSDPTVIYGIENFNGDLTKADLRRKTPYNTYVIPGLPAGPVCNPGEAALEAVLAPAATPCYYFVSRNDGSHYFSKTLREHNRAVYKFQKLRRKR